MSREERVKLIKSIEELRNSKLITYVTSDRGKIVFPPQGVSAPDVLGTIRDDAVWVFYRILREIRRTNRIDLFIYSRGGDVAVPWKLVSLIREHCEEFNVLIPFRAHSAATMIAMGADSIVCCSGAELGPIDPSLNTPFNPRDPRTQAPLPINIEAVRAYLEDFVEKIRGENGQLKALEIFVNQTNALAIGEIFRQTRYIRQVARSILESSKKNRGKDLDEIIKKLIEETYYHGHAITRKEAKEIGLAVEFADGRLERLMIDLLHEYMDEFRCTEAFCPWGIADTNRIQVPAAFIESSGSSFAFNLYLQPSFRRQMPQTLQLNINFPLPQDVAVRLRQEPDLNRLLNELVQKMQQAIQQVVAQEPQRRAPVVGVDIKIVGAKWEEL